MLQTLSEWFSTIPAFQLPTSFPRMVWLIGGYPIPYSDAKAWALRHWPDIHIYDDLKIPVIVTRYLRSHGRKLECICVDLDDGPGLVCFVVVYSKEDPQSTPLKHRQFPEEMLALKCKGLIFDHKDDRKLAEKVKFTTVADPYRDYHKFRPLPNELKRKRAATSQENQQGSATLF